MMGLIPFEITGERIQHPHFLIPVLLYSKQAWISSLLIALQQHECLLHFVKSISFKNKQYKNHPTTALIFGATWLVGESRCLLI